MHWCIFLSPSLFRWRGIYTNFRRASLILYLLEHRISTLRWYFLVRNTPCYSLVDEVLYFLLDLTFRSIIKEDVSAEYPGVSLEITTYCCCHRVLRLSCGGPGRSVIWPGSAFWNEQRK